MDYDKAWLSALGDVAREQARGVHAEPASVEPGEQVTGIRVSPKLGGTAVDTVSHDTLAFSQAVHEPLGAEARARIAQSLQPTGKVVQLPRRPSRVGRWVAGAGVLAAAALALVVLRNPTPQGAELPLYELTHRGGAQQQRGDAAEEVLRLGPGRSLELILRPSTRFAGLTELHGLVVQGEDARAVTLQTERSASGVLRVRGEARHLLGPATTRAGSLALALCVPEQCETAREVARGGQDRAGNGWQVWTLPFTWDANSSSP